MKFIATISIVVSLICLALPGCGGPKVKGLVPVRGTVVYNGEPLAGASIGLTPKDFDNGARIGAGMTDANGRFELRTIGERGVLPGEYVVVVIKNEIVPQTPQGNPRPGRPPPSEVKSLLPKRYGDPKTSDLNVVVEKSGLTNWLLELVD